MYDTLQKNFRKSRDKFANVHLHITSQQIFNSVHEQNIKYIILHGEPTCFVVLLTCKLVAPCELPQKILMNQLMRL